ncbi:MAG: hypothetical protein JWQ74_3179 [Marmoricola sp.]|nr:hypothetical protein [Marmoricola sp.]
MKKLVLVGLGALVALMVTLGVTPSAFAYPELSCNVTVDAQRVQSGDVLKVHASSQQFTTGSRAAAQAVSWSARFNGQTRTATVADFNTSFRVPTVTKPTSFTLKVQAIMPDNSTTCQKSLDIQVGATNVSPPNDDDHLPNTGGPRLILLIAGLGLVVAGGAAVRQSRKERAPHAH